MDKKFIKIGEILILPPFNRVIPSPNSLLSEEELLQPLWDKGFKTCVVDSPEGASKWIIMKDS